jgi:D-alanyl-D-alanine dipeptidase
MPYQPCTPHLRWVDDPESLFYNRPVEAVPGEDEGWRSAEVMARPDGLYRLGVVVGHNTQAIEPGAGSCIFIHVWKGPLGGTAGCTALALEPLERLVGWLDPQAGPVLVQLPRPVLHRTETLSALARSCSQL